MILHSHSTYAMMLMLIKMGYELEFFKVAQSYAYFLSYQIVNQKWDNNNSNFSLSLSFTHTQPILCTLVVYNIVLHLILHVPFDHRDHKALHIWKTGVVFSLIVHLPHHFVIQGTFIMELLATLRRSGINQVFTSSKALRHDSTLSLGTQSQLSLRATVLQRWASEHTHPMGEWASFSLRPNQPEMGLSPGTSSRMGPMLPKQPNRLSTSLFLMDGKYGGKNKT